MSKKAANDTTLQSTKQMLDELDALMEQMLSLPVNDPEDVPAFPKEVVKAHALSATLTMLEASMPPHEPRVAEPITHPAWNAPHRTMPEYPPPPPLTNAPVPVSLLPQMEPLLAEIPETDVAATTQWVYMPLVWVNQSFDASTMMFGGLGGLMRRQGSRMVLGVFGVGMLMFSAAWLAKDWLGWNW